MKVNSLQTLIRLGLAMVVCCLLPQSLKATHIIGGDMEYDIVSIDEINNTMTVNLRLAIYRDCFFGDPDVYFDSPAHIGIFNQANVLIRDWELAFAGVDDTLDQGLDAQCLVNLEPVCVHTTTYQGTITLPIIAGGYTFAYQRCCRNETIDNVVDPLETGATFLIRIREEAIQRENNSPQYKQWPPIYICANEPLVFDHGATDVDGDSLVYKLCTPFDGGTFSDPQPIPTNPPPYDTIVWVSGISVENLLGTGDPLRIDPNTGVMRANPSTVGQFVVGVCVEEYDRNTGELLSIVRRDFQYNVNPCEEITASFEAPTAQCDDSTVVFNNTSTGATVFEWYINGELFSNDNSGQLIQTLPDTGTFMIDLVAVPNTICVDTFSQSIFLQRNSILPDFFLAVINCVDSAVLDLTDLSLDTIATIDSREWIVEYGANSDTLRGDTVTTTLPLGVSGTVTLIVRNVNGCSETLTRPFDTNLPNPTDFVLGNQMVCVGDSFRLNPNAPAEIDFNYAWSPAELVDDPTAQSPMAMITEDTEFTVVITNGIDGCSTELTREVRVFDEPVAGFSTTEECGGITYNFMDESVNADQYFYDFGVLTSDSDTSSVANPSFTFPASGTYTVTQIVTSVDGCTDTLSREIVVVEDSQIDLMIDDLIQTCDSTVTLAPTAAVPVTFAYFDAAENEIGTGPTLTVAVSGGTIIRVVATAADSCTDSQEVTIIGGPADISAPDTVLNCGLMGIDLGVTNEDSNDTLTYDWMPAELFDASTLNSPNPTFIGTFGEYNVSVTATNQFNCSVTRNILLVVLDDTATLDFTAEPECDGLTVNFTQTGTATFGFQWDLDGLGNSNEENPSFVFPEAGTYTVTLSSAYDIDCLDPVTREVVVPEVVLSADFTVSEPMCSDEGLVLNFMEAVTNNSSDTLSYQWTFSTGTPSGSTEPNPSVTLTSNDSLTVTLTVTTEGDCSSTAERTFAIGLPNVNLPEDVTICPGDSTDLNPGFDPELTYSWEPATGFNPNTPNPRVGTSGTYIVTVFDPAADINCPAMDTIVVTVADSINLVLVGPDGPIGNGDGGGSGGGGGTGGGSGGSGGGDGTIVLPTITTCGEPVELTAEVDANVDVVFTDINGNVLGNGTQIILNTNDRDTVIATATDAFGCMVMDTVVLINNQVDAVPDVSGMDITLCEAQDTTLGVTNLDPRDTLTYVWTDNPIINGPLDGPTVSITPNEEGTVEIMVLVTNQFGCDTTITYTVTVEAFMPNEFPPTVDACFNEATPLNPGGEAVPGYEYDWDPAEGDFSNPANPIVTLTDSTTYTVTITDPATGCISTQTIAVAVAPEIAFEATPPDSTLCEPGSVTFTSTNAVGAVVTWYVDPERTMVLGTGSDITLDIDEAGTITAYGQAVDTTSGCTEELEVSLTLEPFMPNEFPPTVDACFNEATPLNPGGEAVPGYEYDWDPAEGDFSNPANPIVTLTDSTTYTVTITDPASGCTSTQTIAVAVAPEIAFEATPPDSTLCEPGSVTFTSTNAVGAVVTWYVDPERTMVLGMGSDITLDIDEAGTITAYGQAVDTTSGCTEELEVSLTLEPFMPNEFPPEITACFNQPTTISGGTAVPGYEYEWNPTTGGDFSDPANPVVTLTMDTTYMVTITDPANGCSSVQTIMVTVGPEINFVAQPLDTALCEPGEVNITSTNDIGAEVTWYSDPGLTMVIGTGGSISVTVDEPGVLMVYGQAVDTASGCTEEQTITITYNPITDGLPSEAVFGCADDEVPPGIFPGGTNPNYTYTYEPEGNVDLTDPNNPVWAGNGSGEVLVTVTDPETGCSVTVPVQVTITDLGDLTGRAEPPTVIVNDPSVLTVEGCQGECTYVWIDPDGTVLPGDGSMITVTPGTPGILTYEVIVTLNGCPRSVFIELEVIDDLCTESSVYIPNAFTPNGDNNNDVLRVRSRILEELIEYELMIFNRWGQQMFRSFDPFEVWDGTFEGEALEPDVYGYYLRVICPDETELVQKGNISLLR